MKEFTFHYVSISTMTAVSVIMNVILIYIPLCIYFNPDLSKPYIY